MLRRANRRVGAGLEKLRVGLFHGCAWGSRLLILALVVLTPWFYGGVQWQAELIIVGVSALIAVMTLIAVLASSRRAGHPAQLTYFLLAMLLLGLAQCVSLPASLSGRLSSQAFIDDAHQMIEGRPEPVNQQPPDAILQKPLERTISVCPSRSRAALAVLAAAVIVLWSSSMFFASRRWAIVLVATLAITGLINAGLGIIQRVAWNGWSLLKFPKESFYSTFVLRSSAADYFAVVLGAVLVILGLAYRNQKRKRRQEYRVTYPSDSFGSRIRTRLEDVFIDLDTLAVACLCSVAFLFVSAFATYSRGGTIAVLGAGVAALSLTLGTKNGAARSFMTIIFLMLAATSLLMFFDLDDQLVKRFDELNRVAYEREDGRLEVWRYTLSAIAWYWLTGSGLCTYQFALLPFHSGPSEVWFQHAENLYLEVFLEFGLVGLVVMIAAIAMLFRDLLRESIARREDLLLPGAAFAMFALVLHSCVDFSLILPGIFLPAVALLGAFDGRVRREDAEQRYRESHPHASGDARRRVSMEEHQTSRRAWHERHVWRLVVGLAVPLTCLFAQWRGLEPLRGFAGAEALNVEFERLEKEASKVELESEPLEDLKQASARLTQTYPRNPEVQLLAGRIELLALRCEMFKEFVVSQDSHINKWELTHPQATLMFLNVQTEDPRVRALQQRIASSASRAEHLENGVAHFATTLATCPMDGRAAWGLYLCGLGQLPSQDEQLAGNLLMLLARNNSQTLFKAGLAAVASGTSGTPERELGKRLLAMSIDLQKRTVVQRIPVALPYLSAEEGLTMVPTDDVVLCAKTAQSVHGVSPIGRDLADRLLALIGADLSNAVPQDNAGLTALLWAAEQLDDKPLAIRLLHRMLVSGLDTPENRFHLAHLLYDAGQILEAISVLDGVTTSRGATPAMVAEAKQLQDKWRREWTKLNKRL